ncbi:hypothetical protein TNIN_85011 [Trichonephila inaurata madagascariensis]|uniref:Uncharacterized protein n=1 Tax=Trichonephila inaurata madagascariensis TaxID=2747483 RepID=A0A8X7BW57_9ARAC|nr:hypothetical protein TNIN_85011 [Trichonephila inaurata madagascariensis]
MTILRQVQNQPDDCFRIPAYINQCHQSMLMKRSVTFPFSLANPFSQSTPLYNSEPVGFSPPSPLAGVVTICIAFRSTDPAGLPDD